MIKRLIYVLSGFSLNKKLVLAELFIPLVNIDMIKLCHYMVLHDPLKNDKNSFRSPRLFFSCSTYLINSYSNEK